MIKSLSVNIQNVYLVACEDIYPGAPQATVRATRIFWSAVHGSGCTKLEKQIITNNSEHHLLIGCADASLCYG